MISNSAENAPANRGNKTKTILLDILLLAVLLAGAYFRFVGIDWGEFTYLHPDERFLVWVGTDITPMKCLDASLAVNACPTDELSWIGLGEYFDTANSNLNPANRGHAFYVYGTLPMFLARYAVQLIYDGSGFNQMTQVGRPLSALADLLIVLLVYAIASRLYDRRVGVLGAAFSAATVMEIQQSHFFTMDNFLNFFTYLAIYFAVRTATIRAQEAQDQGEGGVRRFFKRPDFLLSIGFGLALGAAVASKLNAAPVALVLPAAYLLRGAKTGPEKRESFAYTSIGYLVLAAVISLLAFRVFQPYAFTGPGFFGVRLDPQWVSSIKEQRAQAAGDVDFPPALQWARRPVTFSGRNLVLWGLGLPLGVLAWGGFLWAGWRMLASLKQPDEVWSKHGLLWGWTAFYFIWQSLQFNPTMRYQLPIYPALAIFAAWAVVRLWDRGRQGVRRGGWRRMGAPLVGGLVLVSTFAWAFGFTRIYTRPFTRVAASRWIYENIPGPINVHIQTEEGNHTQPLTFPYEGFTINPGEPYRVSFTARQSGSLESVSLAHAVDRSGNPEIKSLQVSVSHPPDEAVLTRASLKATFDQQVDDSGERYVFQMDDPVTMKQGENYQLTLELLSGSGEIALSGTAVANEGDWDDGLPVRIDGYDGYGGIYPTGLNFNMYTDDNPEKLAHFVDVLDRADYLFISSSRQWASLPRLPERFPMTTVYYRSLLGCPPSQAIEWCYNVAQPGTFEGQLGFELVEVFQSDPKIGPLQINDQSAEEAFTVYDHPKVFIFKKSSSYNRDQVLALLGAVDFSQVVRVTPKKAGSHPANLMLPPGRWAQQRLGGTWSQLFNTSALQNRSQVVSVLLWYLAVGLLGLAVYPLVRLALPGLADRGYPLSRLVGILALAYLVWLAGSWSIPFNRLTITASAGLLILVSGGAAYVQREALKREWRERKRYYLLIEGLFLAFFLFDLLIRFGNPDLWHPAKGGEKPMDFAYFNAVLKSTTFPPYDPWFAGGYLNYYYYGFVLMGVPVKWLGIVPSVAYNLILPTVFAMIAMGAFSLGWNLLGLRLAPRSALSDGGGGKPPPSEDESLAGTGSPRAGPHKDSRWPAWLPVDRLIAGLAGAAGMAVLGNLGVVKMIYEGYQKIAAPGGVIEGAGLVARWIYAIQGFLLTLGGESLPYDLGMWYWNPSRVIPAPGEVEPITEFPFFTVLYGDPHAHLFALPITLLALAFALSVVLARGRWRGVGGTLAGFLLGGLAIGALRPTNTWDFYPYLALGGVGVAYAYLRYDQTSTGWRALLGSLPTVSRRLLIAAGGVLGLTALSLLLYRPYSQWYGLGYGKIDIWRGTHTPLSAYLTHWGLFLFLIVSWMAWETRDWMASTPASSLRKLKPYQGLIQAGVVALLLVVVALMWLGVGLAWFILPLAAWAGVLLLRPDMPDSKRFVLFLVGTGFVLTLMVEVIVLRGDIARMNTVFKFYLQVWTLFAASAAASLVWLLKSLGQWRPSWRGLWQLSLAALVAGAALYPLLGGLAKIKDRMAPEAPHTLDGQAYMQYAHYADVWGVMDLSQDYQAIRWMQENVVGSPVIVEANLRDLYRWGSRFSIYTGLPGVVGWEWHEQQQRALLPPNWVSDRIAEIDSFYQTTDLQEAREFLQKYKARYIILGQQERGHYPGPGLDKFPAADGVLWRQVYQDEQTSIYEVIPR
jgi:YYY domain-containing protein